MENGELSALPWEKGVLPHSLPAPAGRERSAAAPNEARAGDLQRLRQALGQRRSPALNFSQPRESLSERSRPGPREPGDPLQRRGGLGRPRRGNGRTSRGTSPRGERALRQVLPRAGGDEHRPSAGSRPLRQRRAEGKRRESARPAGTPRRDPAGQPDRRQPLPRPRGASCRAPTRGDASPPGFALQGLPAGRPETRSDSPRAATGKPRDGSRAVGSPAAPEAERSRRGAANPPHLPCHNRRHLPQTLAKTPTLARAPPSPHLERACASPWDTRGAGGREVARPAHSAPGFSPQTQQPGRGNRAALARTRHGHTAGRGESGEFSRELSMVGGAGDSLCPLVRLAPARPPVGGAAGPTRGGGGKTASPARTEETIPGEEGRRWLAASKQGAPGSDSSSAPSRRTMSRLLIPPPLGGKRWWARPYCALGCGAACEASAGGPGRLSFELCVEWGPSPASGPPAAPSGPRRQGQRAACKGGWESTAVHREGKWCAQIIKCPQEFCGSFVGNAIQVFSSGFQPGLETVGQRGLPGLPAKAYSEKKTVLFPIALPGTAGQILSLLFVSYQAHKPAVKTKRKSFCKLGIKTDCRRLGPRGTVTGKICQVSYIMLFEKSVLNAYFNNCGRQFWSLLAINQYLMQYLLQTNEVSCVMISQKSQQKYCKKNVSV